MMEDKDGAIAAV